MIRASVEGWVQSSDVNAFVYPLAPPAVIRVKELEIILSETMASISGVLHYCGFVLYIIGFGHRH